MRPDLPEPAPNFAEALFGGSRFVSRCLAPVLVCAAIGFLMTVRDWRSWQAAWPVVLSLVCLLFALALVSPRRCAWAARCVTGMVFLACGAYVVAACFPDQRGESVLMDALSALFVFGLPALWFTLRRSRPAA